MDYYGFLLGRLVGFNVGLGLRSGLLPTLSDSSLRIVRRHAITLLIFYGGDGFLLGHSAFFILWEKTVILVFAYRLISISFLTFYTIYNVEKLPHNLTELGNLTKGVNVLLVLFSFKWFISFHNWISTFYCSFLTLLLLFS